MSVKARSRTRGFEGDALGLRPRALYEHGHHLEHLHILRASHPLSPRIGRDGLEEQSVGEAVVTAALDDLTAALTANDRPPIRLLVIDTVRASMTGSEDSSDHVSAYLRTIRRLLSHVPKAAAILVHHAGWQDGETQRKRERGSSAWRGNCDGTVYLEAGEYDATRGEARLTIRTLKLRDAEPPPPLHLIRRRVELPEMAGDDIRRGPVTSCIIESDRRTRADREAEHAHAAEAEHRQTDLCVLRVLAEHPDASSQRAIRAYAGLSVAVVTESITRIIRGRQWATPPARQRHPYTLTDAGLAALAEGKC